jgi:hypothetical protein
MFPNSQNARGRIAPSPPPKIVKADKPVFVGAYPWNSPRPAISKERPLTRDEFHQGQDALRKIHALPFFLSGIFLGRYEYLKESTGLLAAHRYLINVFMPRIWPRIEVVQAKYELILTGRTNEIFTDEAESYRQLAGMNDKALKRLAMQISSRLFTEYEEQSDQLLSQHNGVQAKLFTDSAQQKIYGQVAGAARVFNITPMHWQKYCKRKLDMRAAFSSVARLVNDEWWIRQLKAQRTQWRESLLIAVGEVSLQKSGYASKQAIRDVRARRLANMEYLKSCDLENIETGERIDLIDKVMGSISNPEIRRMELMSTIAGIEKYASEVGHAGMFITITTPSKYHPTRMVGKKSERRVNFNHKWDEEAFSPKDGQRYLVKIWGKMRTAFKDNGIKVYGMRVVEPHHDATPHWHMMLFCDKAHRQSAIDIMRRYALKEDGQERGAQAQRFECKHLNKGGAAGYIAKYIAKNIDGYALEGEIDHETGRSLSETAGAVTAWASTWRIPQFKSIGVPTMGAYRELRRLPRGVSIAAEFDELVEAARTAADTGDFAAYISAQGGANVPRDEQTVRTARQVIDELNEYDEEIQKIIGVYAPHLGPDLIHETRTTKWRIVTKAVEVAVHPLNLISAPGAPRSPVNNCGEAQTGLRQSLPPTPSEYATAVMKLVKSGDVGWDEPDVTKVLGDAARRQISSVSHQQYSFVQAKSHELSPSARLTKQERAQIPQIYQHLVQYGLTPNRWELEVLARGAAMIFDGTKFLYPAIDDWLGFPD